MNWLAGNIHRGTLRRLPLLALVIALPCTASPANANLSFPRAEWGVFGGLFVPSNEHELYEVYVTQQRPFIGVLGQVGARAALLPWRYFAIEAEASMMPAAAVSDHRSAATLFSTGGHLLAQYPTTVMTPFFVGGASALGVLSTRRDSLGRDVDLAWHYGVGLKLPLRRWLRLRFDLRHVLSGRLYDGGVGHHISFLVGVSMVHGVKAPDRDGDGVPNKLDACPRIKGTLRGCPDGDGDGVADHLDACRTKKGPARSAGCPDGDSDGVADREDRCPQQGGPRWLRGCPDRDGDDIADRDDACPTARGLIANGGCPDTDHDGVVDKADQCPTEAGKHRTKGCPDRDEDGLADGSDVCPDSAGPAPSGCPDSDGDGIIDKNDRCKMRPETRNHYRDDDGCPDQLPPIMKRFNGMVPKVTFFAKSARLHRRATRVLNDAVRMLKIYPQLRLLIRCHTDNHGSAARNLALSLARANAIRAYIFGKGVRFERIDVEGVGGREPLVSNRTWRGRKKNNRVQFKLLPKKRK